MALVVRDILRPEHDLVRRGGVDDPWGGVFDRAEDRFTLDLSGRAARPARLGAAADVMGFAHGLM